MKYINVECLFNGENIIVMQWRSNGSMIFAMGEMVMAWRRIMAALFAGVAAESSSNGAQLYSGNPVSQRGCRIWRIVSMAVKLAMAWRNDSANLA